MDKIYTLESSNGKNDSCAANNKGVNGFGYRQNAHENICFNAHETVRALVIDWVTDKLNAQWSVSSLLCYYNQGRRVNDCPYYQNYLKL